MIPGELTGIYYFPPENPISLVLPNSPINFTNNITTDDDPNIQSFHNNFFNSVNVNNMSNYYNLQFGAGQTTPSTCSNASSGSEEAAEAEEEQQQAQQMQMMIDERRQRRMISNRESARRSRMRKQKHLDELWAQVLRLRSENHGLIDKLNRVSDCHDRVLHENARLKEEASDLRQMLSHLRIPSPFSAGDLPEHHLDHAHDHDRDDQDDDDGSNNIIACNAAHLKAEASSNKIAKNSVGLLH